MQPILVHFEKSTVEALKAERTRTGCSVSEFIRRAVQAALEKTAEVKP
jgi:Arc/MetJ-type ribon-helix-helix transcriptional regulator